MNLVLWTVQRSLRRIMVLIQTSRFFFSDSNESLWAESSGVGVLLFCFFDGFWFWLVTGDGDGVLF